MRLLALIIVFCSTFCAANCTSQKIICKKIPTNATSYIFDIKIEDARFAVEKSCYGNIDCGLNTHDVYYQGTWKKSGWPQAAKTALEGETHKYDVWMELTVDSSSIYFNKKGKPLKYLLECLLHFTSVNSKTTKMEIQVLNSKVHIRDQLLPSPPHFVNNPVYKNVKPTTIEEYKILQCFGKGLGVFDQMPHLKL